MIDHERVSGLFLAACELPPAERAAFLDRACGDDAALRSEVEAMLAQDALAGGTEGMAARVLGAAGAGGPLSPAPAMPAWIGPYRILDRLGEGGMGVVYRAEQAKPIRREVALKVIRGGADSAIVVARFEAERQTLALMDHPNIAKVLDAGADAEGRPYFVMERIEGDPITGYCRSRRLDARARLRLFLEVCRGVRHAHQRGIIHRDLKPSNVLVTEEAGAPVPKVIDFSIAKALEGSTLETEFRTRTGQVVGTLEYMSPEQARGDVAAVDTRADVWALGVILHELLAERLPFDLSSQPLHEAVRRICEEPVRALRGTTTTASGRLDADLSTIVGKCLQKEPDRRYGSAAELVEDLERYLASRPILARPPSTTYLLGKLVLRHKAAASTLAILVLSLAAFGVTMSILYASQRRALLHAEREARRNQALMGFWEGVFSRVWNADGSLATIPDVIDRTQEIWNEDEGDPELRSSVFASIATINGALLRLDKAISGFRQAVLLEIEVLRTRYPGQADGLAAFARLVRGETGEAEAPVLAAVAGAADRDLRLDIRRLVTVVQGMAYAMMINGDYEQAAVFSREGLAATRLVFGRDEAPQEFFRGILSTSLRGLGRHEEGVAIQEEMIAETRAAHGDDHYAVVTSKIILGSLLLELTRLAEAESTLRDALERSRRLEPDNPNTGMAAFYLGWALQGQGRFDEALALHREHVAHPSTRSERFLGFALYGLGSAEAGLGRLEEGEASLREALRLLEKAQGPNHDRVLRVRLALGVLLLAESRLDEAEGQVRPALEAAEALYGDDRLELAEYRLAAGWLRLAQERPQEAEPLLRSGLSTWEARLPAGDGRVTVARALLGACLARLGRRVEAEPFLAEDPGAIGPTAHPLWQRGARELTSRFRAVAGDPGLAPATPAAAGR